MIELMIFVGIIFLILILGLALALLEYILFPNSPKGPM